MQAWRIARARFALDRSGAGGLVDAGRWHPLGLPVIYAGLSVEICALEKLVHTGRILPPDLQLVRLDLPDDPGLYESFDPVQVPNWAETPPAIASIAWGETFLREQRGLALIVPSAVVPEARNLVINPLHPCFAEVTMAVERPFAFDARLRPAG
ncbi:MAG: RES family NAD+ phosphorylase [Azonexus sp.]